MKKNLGSLIAVFSIVSLPAFAQAPTPPSTTPVERTLTPSESFGAIYGTKNMARPSADGSVRSDAAKKGSADPDKLKAIQNAFRQPPADINAFAAYTRSDGYLKLMETVANDPGLLVLLAANHLALDLTSIDHTTEGDKIQVGGVTRTVFEPTYGEQFGPPRTSRGMALLHLAIFEAINAIDPLYESYKPEGSTQSIRARMEALLGEGTVLNPTQASIPAAINQAAHDVLLALYPRKATYVDAGTLAISISVNADEIGQASGMGEARIELGDRVGAAAAAAVLKARQGDGAIPRGPDLCQQPVRGEDPRTILPTSLCYETYFKPMTPSQMQDAKDHPLRWTIDPVSKGPLRLGSDWGDTVPFVMKPHEFVQTDGLHLANGHVLQPPKETDADFKDGLNDGAFGPDRADPHDPSKMVKSRYGVRSYGFKDEQTRTPDQTFHAQFWGYDASALLCAPPRLYNMVATAFLDDHVDKLGSAHQTVAAARYLALVNIALADAAVAAWDAKYKYDIARPVTYIRYHALDAKPGDPTWTPLGQVASNGLLANTTPGFPAYPSGHAVFGAAAFQMMANTLGVDKKSLDPKNGSAFSFMSDEYNGHTYGSDGKLREARTVKFVSLEGAEWENAESRVWLGVHWQRDADDGVALGIDIADVISKRALKPLAASSQ